MSTPPPPGADLRAVPEIAALDATRDIVRISPELDVPLTPRVRALIDTAAFRRLSRISQLGLVALVYPSATHSRFEHSLGVYRQALLFLRHLSHDEAFAAAVSPADAERLIVAALLHDLGHWPFCHPIEDMRLEGVPHHEVFVRRHLESDEVAERLDADWGLTPRDVAALLAGDARTVADRILGSILSGPIDIDKIDYLARDSLHAGVPYGRNFDQGRLVSSLCLNERGDGLAIGEKGHTTAKLIIFTRYVMFSEVYWHHGVRSATAMLQRAFWSRFRDLDLDSLFQAEEHEFQRSLLRATEGHDAAPLADGLFGPARSLYKRVAEFSWYEGRDVYGALAYRPYAWLADFAERLSAALSSETDEDVGAHEVLIDAPPVKKEVEFDIDVALRRGRRFRPLEEVSPVVRALAKEQFDDQVKRVRIFAHPRVADKIRALPALADLVARAAAAEDE